MATGTRAGSTPRRKANTWSSRTSYRLIVWPNSWMTIRRICSRTSASLGQMPQYSSRSGRYDRRPLVRPNIFLVVGTPASGLRLRKVALRGFLCQPAKLDHFSGLRLRNRRHFSSEVRRYVEFDYSGHNSFPFIL